MLISYKNNDHVTIFKHSLIIISGHEANADKTKYIFISHHQSARKTRSLVTANSLKMWQS